MRTHSVLLAMYLTVIPCLGAQQRTRPAEAPPGTNWIADRRLKQYYPVDCQVVGTVPLADRLYYATEAALERDGYLRSPDCPRSVPRLEDAPPPAPQVQAVRAQGAPAEAENRHARRGFWFSGGLGYGSLGCEDCGGREGGLSGGLGLGGSVSQKVLLGAGSNGWTRSEGGVTLTVGTLVALIRFYPSATGGFFLLGGLGLGTIHAEIDGTLNGSGFVNIAVTLTRQ